MLVKNDEYDVPAVDCIDCGDRFYDHDGTCHPRCLNCRRTAVEGRCNTCGSDDQDCGHCQGCGAENSCDCPDDRRDRDRRRTPPEGVPLTLSQLVEQDPENVYHREGPMHPGDMYQDGELLALTEAA